MISDYVMTEHNCTGKVVPEDSVGLASYTMDSHHTSRVVVDGFVKAEGNVEKPTPAPYPVSYRAMVPKESECNNLLVGVCVSSSHISYGSIRMEPVFLLLGQSAATAASIAIDDGLTVQKVPYAKLRERLLKDHQILDWTPEMQAKAVAADKERKEKEKAKAAQPKAGGKKGAAKGQEKVPSPTPTN